MRLDQKACRDRMTAARVGYLATSGADRQPHIVPVTFAVVEDRVVTSVDQKPKSTTALRRLSNIAENPSVAVLCDHYDEDWRRLWWVRADGTAETADDDDRPSRRSARVGGEVPPVSRRPAARAGAGRHDQVVDGLAVR